MAFNSYSRGQLDIEAIVAAITKNNNSETIDLLPVELLEGIDHNKIKVKYQHKKLGRRIAPRYGLKFDVLVVSKASSFKAHTINVSETGVLLDRPLPAGFQHEKFEIVMTLSNANNQKIQLLFQAQSADPVGQPLLRIEFLKAVNNSSQKLNALIEELTPIEV